MSRTPSLLIALSLAASPAPLLAAEAHVHGQANLGVAIDGETLTLMLESPTDSLVGFEHAPGSDLERAAVARMKETLEQADKLFLPTAAAECRLASVELHSLLLDGEDGPEPAHEAGHEDDEHEGHEGHADLDGDFTFRCAHPEQLHDLEVRLFDAFPRLKKVKVAVVAPQGQKAADLTATGNRIGW